MFEYVKASKEWMLKEVVEMEWVLKKQVESRDDYRERKERERREGLDEKVFHGKFFSRGERGGR